MYLMVVLIKVKMKCYRCPVHVKCKSKRRLCYKVSYFKLTWLKKSDNWYVDFCPPCLVTEDRKFCGFVSLTPIAIANTTKAATTAAATTVAILINKQLKTRTFLIFRLFSLYVVSVFPV